MRMRGWIEIFRKHIQLHSFGLFTCLPYPLLSPPPWWKMSKVCSINFVVCFVDWAYYSWLNFFIFRRAGILLNLGHWHLNLWQFDQMMMCFVCWLIYSRFNFFELCSFSISIWLSFDQHYFSSRGILTAAKHHSTQTPQNWKFVRVVKLFTLSSAKIVM